MRRACHFPVDGEIESRLIACFPVRHGRLVDCSNWFDQRRLAAFGRPTIGQLDRAFVGAYRLPARTSTSASFDRRATKVVIRTVLVRRLSMMRQFVEEMFPAAKMRIAGSAPLRGAFSKASSAQRLAMASTGRPCLAMLGLTGPTGFGPKPSSQGLDSGRRRRPAYAFSLVSPPDTTGECSPLSATARQNFLVLNGDARHAHLSGIAATFRLGPIAASVCSRHDAHCRLASWDVFITRRYSIPGSKAAEGEATIGLLCGFTRLRPGLVIEPAQFSCRLSRLNSVGLFPTFSAPAEE